MVSCANVHYLRNACFCGVNFVLIVGLALESDEDAIRLVTVFRDTSRYLARSGPLACLQT